MTTTSPPVPRRSPAVTAAALIFVAMNLRFTISALPPVLAQIRDQTGLSSAGGGLLTSVPVFCFGLVAFAAPALIRRMGMSRLLALTMMAVALGSLIRLAPPVVALFLGTALIGAGIAVGNVLVPGLIKRDFHQKAVSMLSFYSVALCVGAAVTAGLTVPLQHLTGMGWRPVLAVWGIFAVVAVIAWAPDAIGEKAPLAIGRREPIRGLWRDRTAWAVTLFMGLQSFSFYALLSWLPTLLHDHGTSSSNAGWLLSFSMFPSMLAALITPGIRHRLRRPAVLLFILFAGYVVSIVGLIASPLLAGGYLWMALLGASQGSALALALGYIVARAPDSHHAAALSTMAQGIGYLLASSGPFILGAVHGWTGSWTVPLILIGASLLPLLGSGLYAGRPRHVLQ